MKYSFLLTATLLSASGCGSQPESNPVDVHPVSAADPSTKPEAVAATSHAAAATASLETLAHLVTPQRSLGFRSVRDAESASLVTPLRMLMVGLDPLRAYHATEDPRTVFTDEQAVIYPVAVAGEVRTSVVVREVNGSWKATQFGRANLARSAHEGRARLVAARGLAEEAISLVEIPTLSTRMLEHDEEGVPMLTALADVPGTDLHAGATLRAADVLAKLQPLAARNDGSAPN